MQRSVSISSFLVASFLAVIVVLSTSSASAEHNKAPKGFRSLFNGEDLSGWHAFIFGGNPYKVAAASPAERKAARAKANEQLAKFWTVENGEIVNKTGKGPYLETVENFGDFELLMDWKIESKADSGIYVRGVPQIQIWDPVDGIKQARVGSGGLYNNKAGPSKPLVKADKPAGEWNHFRIVMVDDVISVWLNGQLVVDDAKQDNYWNRKAPMFSSGPLQIQTHGGALYFRNIFIKEVRRRPPEAGVLDKHSKPVGSGWKKLWDGDKLEGIQHEPAHWSVKGGVLTGKVSGSPKHHYAYTDAEFGDFELHAKVKLNGKNANSGVCIRTKPTSFDDVPGYQVDMGDGFWGCLWDERRDGMVAAYPKEKAAKLVKAGDWNHYYVIARGHHIRAWLNGILTIDVLNPRGIPKGSIAFQLCHGKNREMVAEFKDVYVRPIGKTFHLEYAGGENDEGFTKLFNGKNLDGWTSKNLAGYKVASNKILCQRRGGGNLYTAKEYANFVYRFEFKLPPGANNGLGIRTPTSGDAAYVGFELQILENSHPSYLNLQPYQYHGSLYNLIPAQRGFQRPPGYWNYQEVTVNGKNVKVVLNGVTILDDTWDKDWPEAKRKRHKGLQKDKGHIALFGHGATIEFRNIRIKELP